VKQCWEKNGGYLSSKLASGIGKRKTVAIWKRQPVGKKDGEKIYRISMQSEK